MFNVIQELEIESTPGSIYELMLKRGPSEKTIDGGAKSDMEEEEVGHLVVNKNNDERNILSVSPLDSLFLSIPGMSVSSNHLSC